MVEGSIFSAVLPGVRAGACKDVRNAHRKRFPCGERLCSVSALRSGGNAGFGKQQERRSLGAPIRPGPAHACSTKGPGRGRAGTVLGTVGAALDKTVQALSPRRWHFLRCSPSTEEMSVLVLKSSEQEDVGAGPSVLNIGRTSLSRFERRQEGSRRWGVGGRLEYFVSRANAVS